MKYLTSLELLLLRGASSLWRMQLCCRQRLTHLIACCHIWHASSGAHIAYVATSVEAVPRRSAFAVAAASAAAAWLLLLLLSPRLNTNAFDRACPGQKMPTEPAVQVGDKAKALRGVAEAATLGNWQLGLRSEAQAALHDNRLHCGFLSISFYSLLLLSVFKLIGGFNFSGSCRRYWPGELNETPFWLSACLAVGQPLAN